MNELIERVVKHTSNKNYINNCCIIRCLSDIFIKLRQYVLQDRRKLPNYEEENNGNSPESKGDKEFNYGGDAKWLECVFCFQECDYI